VRETSLGDNRFAAVSLDVGGVLVTPDHGILARVLDRAGVDYDRDRFFEGHYHGMAEVERACSEPETFGDYNHGFLKAVGVPAVQLEAAAAAMDTVMGLPLWCQPIPGAVAAAERLRRHGVRLALTSNADGTVADVLARHEVAQIGPGRGVQVEVVTDSGLIGAHKPDPKVFLATAHGLDLPVEAICHLGDSGPFDADGAEAVGMGAVHLDPLGVCEAGHEHVPSLDAFVDRFVARAGGPTV
jgi:FMN phosphatase YigB (HAD superfamily)